MLFVGIAQVWQTPEHEPFTFALFYDQGRYSWRVYVNGKYEDAEISGGSVPEAIDAMAASYPDAYRIRWMLGDFEDDSVR